MINQTCEICGHKYTASCTCCAKRVMAWGLEGTYEINQMSKREEDINASELLKFCYTHYNRSGKTSEREAVSVLKRSLRSLGYKGKFIGRIHINSTDYLRTRLREHDRARRWRLKKDNCDTCNSDRETMLHHIIPLSWGGVTSDENCTTLCESCHRKTHKKLSGILNRTLLLEYLAPHIDEIRVFALRSLEP